jgi:hypothetical protein
MNKRKSFHFNFFFFLISRTKSLLTWMNIVATLLLERWEDDYHTLEMGTWESAGTIETLEFDFRGQNTLH